MMPALPAWLRLVLAAGFTGFAGIAFAKDQNLVGAICGAAGALMVLAWLRYHDVPRAGQAFNAHDRARALELLEKVPFGGRLLRRECRIYYHHVKSLCLQKVDRWQEAAREAEAAVAAAGGRDEAPGCHLAAAQAYVHLNDVAAARRHAETARRLPHGDAVDRGLARIERVLGEPAA